MIVGADMEGGVRRTPIQPAVPMAAMTERAITISVPSVPVRPLSCKKTISRMIASAAGTTILGCAGLTVVAFITRKDFSFLRGFLMWGGILVLLFIAASVMFGFAMGTWFSVAMIGFAGAAVLYDTSNVMHRYEEDRYVAASLQLFSSIALMFYYVLMLFSSRR